MDEKKLNNLSVAEYLEVEKQTDTRHEYHDGSIFALAGGTVEHGLISGNAFGEIKIALRRKKSSCKPINGEVKLFIRSLNKYVYPDVMVVCGEIEKSDEESNALVNPIVIIEVLSKNTESYDRGDKFYIYRQIPSLKEYILIDQYKPQVEIYKRQSELWEISRISGLDQSFEISALGIRVDLKNIVVFEKNENKWEVVQTFASGDYPDFDFSDFDITDHSIVFKDQTKSETVHVLSLN